MRSFCLWLITGSVLLFALPVHAEKKISAWPERVEVTPKMVALESRRAYRQLVVTGYFRGEARDLTTQAEIRATDSRVIRLQGSRIVAAGNGSATVTVRAGGKTIPVPVKVTNFAKPDPVQFGLETLAVLTKQGCATGSCHGSPHGKGGFSLSLFGYDPRIDRISLTRDGFNRRVNTLEPNESLMLKKPLLEVPHVGGKRLRKTDAAYRIFHDWIYQGANAELPKASCERLLLTPGSARLLHAPYLKQQIGVLAVYSDGTRRDVSAIATYDTSNASVATVDANGLVTGHGRGQTAISVRYLDKLQAVYVTVVEDVKGFAWKSAPENNLIDRMVNAKLKQLQYLPAPTCADAEFLRRVSLDLTGMLPTPEVTRRFLQDRAPDRRARFIGTLLETEEYARFWARKKADLMRVSPRRLSEPQAQEFARWIVDATRANMPYDRFARAILTAQGAADQVAASCYFLAIPSMEERTEMTAQIFMGSRLECAKCHNHPFENWTMRDYYSLAAVFARTQANNGKVVLASAGEAMHPTTKERMRPWGMPKSQGATVDEAADRRAVFAEWLTGRENPFFARVEVNRLWADLLGRGIVEPIDDFRASNPPSNAPLLDALAQEFVKSGYDRKHILRLICNSQTYQRSSQTNRFNATDETLFSHARIRLLSAEQLKDAIGLTTRALSPTDTLTSPINELRQQIEARQKEIEPAYADWVRAREVEANAAREQKDGRKKTDLSAAVLETLAIPTAQRTETHNRLLHDLYLERDDRLRDLRRRLAHLENRMDYATQRPYPELSAFTVTFGEPARDTACTCERQSAPTLLQALELLNGGMAYQAAQNGIGRYASLPDDRLIEELTLSALCRFPTEKERATARQYLSKAGSRESAVMDLIWTVVNMQEFLFQH